jgi:hypothetical protein
VNTGRSTSWLDASELAAMDDAVAPLEVDEVVEDPPPQPARTAAAMQDAHARAGRARRPFDPPDVICPSTLGYGPSF